MAAALGRIIKVMWRRLVQPYGGSKAANEAILTALAQELDGSGVTANVSVPGGDANARVATLKVLRKPKSQFINIAALYSAASTSALSVGQIVNSSVPCCSIASPAATILLSAAATLRTIKYPKSLPDSPMDSDANGRTFPSSSGKTASGCVASE